MGKPKSVKLLLELGADFFIRNEHTVSPLLGACQRKHVEVVEVFEEFGLDLHHWRFNAKNGQTPFLEACKNGPVDLVKPFIDHKNIDEDKLWTCIQNASDKEVLKVDNNCFSLDFNINKFIKAARKKLQWLEEHDEL